MSSGFVLMEVLVTMVIISILAGMLTVAWPAARDRQVVTGAGQQIQSLVREAQRLALHEYRQPECVQLVEARGGNPRRCSDIGVFLDAGSAIIFADIADGTDRYGNSFSLTTQDYVLQRHSLPVKLQVEPASQHTVLFKASPPTITTLIDGQATSGQLELRAGQASSRLIISTYGKLEAQ